MTDRAALAARSTRLLQNPQTPNATDPALTRRHFAARRKAPPERTETDDRRHPQDARRCART